jgi:PAS domain S-box-containing protein
MRFPPARPRHQRGQATLSVVLSYGIFAALWILFSDKAVEVLFDDPALIIRASMIKGWLFVAVTTALLYVLVKRQITHLNNAHRKEVASLQERQKSIDLLNAIVDNSSDAIYAKDSEGRYLLFNGAACRYAGKPASEILGHNDRDLFLPEQADRLMAADRRIMAEDKIHTTEEILDTALGRKTLLTTKGPLHDAAAHTVGIFGISHDITERMQAESVLAESEGRFRALVEQSLAGIYIIQEGYFRYVNPGFAVIFGYASPADLIDKVPVSELISPEDSARVVENIRRRVEGEIVDIHYTFRGSRRDGRSIDVEVHGRMFEYQGKPAVIGLILDVTARKRAEEELHTRSQELERFNQAMIGRELDMVEMKQRINELSKALGREPPYDLAFLDQTPDNDKISHGS